MGTNCWPVVKISPYFFRFVERRWKWNSEYKYRCCGYNHAWIILCMGSPTEERRYNVTSSLIGWAHPKKEPCSGQALVNRFIVNSGHGFYPFGTKALHKSTLTWYPLNPHEQTLKFGQTKFVFDVIKKSLSRRRFDVILMLKFGHVSTGFISPPSLHNCVQRGQPLRS